MAEPTSDQQNLAAAIAEVSDRVTLLVREEIELAKTEVTTKLTRIAKGVGVGLAVARRVARGLGGDIRVTTGAAIAGQFFPGAVFWLTVATRAPTIVLDTSSG